MALFLEKTKNNAKPIGTAMNFAYCHKTHVGKSDHGQTTNARKRNCNGLISKKKQNRLENDFITLMFQNGIFMMCTSIILFWPRTSIIQYYMDHFGENPRKAQNERCLQLFSFEPQLNFSKTILLRLCQPVFASEGQRRIISKKVHLVCEVLSQNLKVERD